MESVLKFLSRSKRSLLLKGYVSPSYCIYNHPVLLENNVAAIQVPIVWEEVAVYPISKDGKTTIPDDALVSINKNKVALKGEHRICRLFGSISLTLSF